MEPGLENIFRSIFAHTIWNNVQHIFHSCELIQTKTFQRILQLTQKKSPTRPSLCTDAAKDLKNEDDDDNATWGLV